MPNRANVSHEDHVSRVITVPGSQLMVDSCNVKRVAPRSRARHRARSLTLCRDSPVPAACRPRRASPSGRRRAGAAARPRPVPRGAGPRRGARRTPKPERARAAATARRARDRDARRGASVPDRSHRTGLRMAPSRRAVATRVPDRGPGTPRTPRRFLKCIFHDSASPASPEVTRPSNYRARPRGPYAPSVHA